MNYFDDDVNLLNEQMSYGDMPYDMYLRKNEVTNMYENPNDLNKYQRSLLTDFSPDEPFLASDDIRSSNDPDSGFQSTSRLDLLHSGARSSDDPYLPDGTFLDWEFMQKDPRGTALGPDMRKHVEQQFARANLIKFYDDSDNSVPESGITPEQMVTNIRSLQGEFKRRFTNFDTARGNFNKSSAKNGTTNPNSILDKTTVDGVVLDITKTPNPLRPDATSMLSNDYKVSYRWSTPDHRVKVAKYGEIYTRNYLNNEQDSMLNRYTTQYDQPFIDLDGTLVNKMTAQAIMNLQGIRETMHNVNDTYYHQSEDNQQRGTKVPDEVIHTLLKTKHNLYSNNEELANYMQYEGLTPKNTRLTTLYTTLNHYIAPQMQLAVYAARNKNDDDYRKLIENIQSTVLLKESNTQHSKVMQNITDTNIAKARENIKPVHYVEESKETKQYSHIQPTTNKNVNNTGLTKNTIDYQKSRTTSDIRKRKIHANVQNYTNTTRYDTDQGKFEFGTYTKAKNMDVRQTLGRNDLYNTVDATDHIKEHVV